MYESKSEPGRKFGSAFRGKRFDSYHGGEQPGGNNENEKAEPKNLSGDMDHGKITAMHYTHDHEKGMHSMTATHEDGHQTGSVHPSAAEAYEAGGELQATDVKKREHPDQQGAESEERNYEMPDLA